MRLNALLDGLNFEDLGMEVIDMNEAEITSITLDSRVVEKGALFAALPGVDHDGYDYIDDAISKGTSAILAERS